MPSGLFLWSGLNSATSADLTSTFSPAAVAVGLKESEVGNMLSIAWAGHYGNDFMDNCRAKRVYIQGDVPCHMVPKDLEHWRVHNATGGLAPFSPFSTTSRKYGAQMLYRYNGVAAAQLQRSPAEGVMTGEAMAEMRPLAAQRPSGFELSGRPLRWRKLRRTARQACFMRCRLGVFLSLAVLYESWSVPFAGMLARWLAHG